MSSELNVSLPPHLLQQLNSLPPHLPIDLRQKLSPYLVDPPPPTIPYDLLHTLSKHVRSDACTLENKRDYEMVSLLAGCTTSPERSFPPKLPSVGGIEIRSDMESEQKLKKEERKAITALVNAIGSIIGSGVAAHWASERTGWRNEWRVLFTLLVAIVVAASEAILYLIWQSRSTPKPLAHTRVTDKKSEQDTDEQVTPEATSTQIDVGQTLRKR